MNRRKTNRRGFTMIETMMAVLLLVIFFDAAGKVFNSTVLMSSGSQDLCDQASQVDSAMQEMKWAVWGSEAITVTDPRSVEVVMAGGKGFSWKIDGENYLVRTNPEGRSERVARAGGDWKFSSDKVSLTVWDGTATPMRMVSQFMLAQSEKP